MIHFGIDTLLANRLGDLRGRRVGLITNDAATTAVLPHPLTPVRLALQQAGVRLVALFAPEHGLCVAAAALCLLPAFVLLGIVPLVVGLAGSVL